MRPPTREDFSRVHPKVVQVLDWAAVTLIIVSVAGYCMETLPDISDASRRWLGRLEAVTVVLFTVEYGFRLWMAKSRWRYATSFFGIIDLLSILPFYLALGFDARPVRALRLLRMFRLLKLALYNKATRRFSIALKIAREEIILFLSAAGVVLFLAAIGIHHFEHEAQPERFASVFDSLWWAVVTLTTVGYGDVVPITAGGKLFTFFVLLVGLGIVSVPAGLVASALGEARQLEDEQAKK